MGKRVGDERMALAPSLSLGRGKRLEKALIDDQTKPDKGSGRKGLGSSGEAVKKNSTLKVGSTEGLNRGVSLQTKLKLENVRQSSVGRVLVIRRMRQHW